jgi:hypothetical protein
MDRKKLILQKKIVRNFLGCPRATTSSVLVGVAWGGQVAWTDGEEAPTEEHIFYVVVAGGPGSRRSAEQAKHGEGSRQVPK